LPSRYTSGPFCPYQAVLEIGLPCWIQVVLLPHVVKGGLHLVQTTLVELELEVRVVSVDCQTVG
jgi:hypothetical protein